MEICDEKKKKKIIHVYPLLDIVRKQKNSGIVSMN